MLAWLNDTKNRPAGVGEYPLSTTDFHCVETARQRHTDQGKLFVHDRVTLLLDPQSPFLELSPLADWDPLLWARALPVAHMFQR